MGFSFLCGDHKNNPPNNPRHQLKIDHTHCSQSIEERYCVKIGTSSTCTNPVLISPFMVNCTLSPGKGEGLDVTLQQKTKSGECSGSDIVARLPQGVSYREVINFKEKFNQFVDYGVGGLKKEIEELYRRAFASRG